MKESNPTFQYGFDFSQGMSYEIDKNDRLDELIKEAIKEEQESPRTRIIDPIKKENLFKVRAYLYHIAKENQAKVTVKHGENMSRICVEIECEVIDFDTDVLKSCFAHVLRLSKFVSIETRTNGKSAIIAEVDIFKNDEK